MNCVGRCRNYQSWLCRYLRDQCERKSERFQLSICLKWCNWKQFPPYPWRPYLSFFAVLDSCECVERITAVFVWMKLRRKTYFASKNYALLLLTKKKSKMNGQQIYLVMRLLKKNLEKDSLLQKRFVIQLRIIAIYNNEFKNHFPP